MIHEQLAQRSFQASFAGSVVLVTGGTSGIGFLIATRFVQARANVVVVGTSRERGQEAEQSLRQARAEGNEGDARFLPGNVASRREMDDVAAEIKRRYGRLDVLVCSAGIGRKATLLETSEADLASLLQVNVQGPVVSVQATAELLAESQGAAILLSSDAGIMGEPNAGAYSVSKAAVNMAGKMLALDLAGRNVRVNVVAPGDIVPGMKSMTRVGEKARPQNDYLSWPQPPLGRYGTADDVAGTVLFLASEAAAFITGSVVLVDGGMRAGMPS